MLEIVPYIAQTTHGIRNIFADIRNVPTAVSCHAPSSTYLPLLLPAVIMEDNSTVVTISNEESAYLKECKHLIMVVNYLREQLEFGLIQVLKIKDELKRTTPTCIPRN